MNEYRELQAKMRRANPKRDTWQWCTANWGCYFLSVCQMCGVIPTADNLERAYNRALESGGMITNETTHCLMADALKAAEAIDPQNRKWQFKRDSRPYTTKNPDGYPWDIICYATGQGDGTHFVLWGAEDTEVEKPRRILGHRYFGVKNG